MIKVDNRKVVAGIAADTYKAHWKRNIITVSAILMTTFLTAVVFALGFSYWNTVTLRTLRMNGMDYDVELSEPRPDQVDIIRAMEDVETVVLLSHKKADSYIHIDVEFGEGEGKIPVDSIAKRAEAYKPKEKVTYKMIKEYIEAKYGFKVHTAYIAEVKRNLGLPMYDAPNAVEELKQPRKHPTPEKVEAIKDALRYFAVI